MAGIWRIPVGECGLELSDPPFICARCDGEAERGFQWDFDEIVVCEGCVVPIVAAMIFDVIRERHDHVTPELVREIGRQLNQGSSAYLKTWMGEG